GPAIDEVIAIAGPLAEDYTTMEWLDPENPDAAPMVAAYRAKYGEGPINQFVPVMYNAAKLVLEAMKRADSIELPAVAEELRNLSGHPTLLGPVRWGGME